MLTGLDILLARMKTNPEEFLTEGKAVPYDGEIFGGKWSDLLDYAWRVANKEEQEMIKKARDEFYRDDFNERVFKRLAGEEKQGEKEEARKIRMGERYGINHSDPRVLHGGVGFSGGGTLNTNTQMMGSQTLEEYEQHYRHIQEQARQEQYVREKMEYERELHRQKMISQLKSPSSKRKFWW
jgi:hypothetical protein